MTNPEQTIDLPAQLPHHGPWKLLDELEMNNEAWNRLAGGAAKLNVLSANQNKIRLEVAPTMLSRGRTIHLVRDDHAIVKAWMCFQGKSSLGRRPGNFRAEMGEAMGLIQAAAAGRKPAWIFGRSRNWTIITWLVLLGALVARLVWITG